MSDLAKQLQSFVAMVQTLDPTFGTGDTEATPGRWYDAMVELTSGYNEDPSEHLLVEFQCADYDEMIVVGNIAVQSICEHHLLPFVGTATVAYIPDGGRITGLSKIARCVRGYARRFQLQERLTAQIANAIDARLSPKGVGVLVQCEHMCMTLRGVSEPGAVTTTSCLRGLLFEQDRARAEFLALARRPS